MNTSGPPPASQESEFGLGPEGFVLVLTGPPGVGKTSMSRELQTEDGISPCVTTTTRERRPDEKDGVHYHFVSEGEFQEMVTRGAFVEWAEVYSHHYGSTHEAVRSALSGGKVMLVVVDVQGATHWKSTLGSRCVTVFVLPPNPGDLRKRLAERNTEEMGSLERRIQSARAEIQLATSFDYVIVNDRVERAVDDLRSVLQAERLRPVRVQGFLGRYKVE